MTDPQLRAAKTGHASWDIRFESCGLFIIPKEGSIDNFASDSITRANTAEFALASIDKSQQKVTYQR
jgi:hypothetical protein